MKEAIKEKESALSLISDNFYESQKQMAKLQREISKLKQHTADLQAAVERLERHLVPLLEDTRKDNGMAIIQKNNGDPDYPSIAICGKQYYVSQKFQHKMIDYPNSQRVVLAETSNAIVHYNWLCEQGYVIPNPDCARYFKLKTIYTHQKLMELDER